MQQQQGQQQPFPWVVSSGGRTRFFCPCTGCLHGDTARANGWSNVDGVRKHLLEHRAGRFAGAVPQAFLDAYNLCSCTICGKVITKRFNGKCPKCAPRHREALGARSSEGSAAAGLPSLDEVCTARVRLLKYVPRGARALWGQALAQTTAAAVWHNSAQAWTEFAMLPKCVLFAPPRQGKANKEDTVAFTKLRCQRWLAGERSELWLDGPGAGRGPRRGKAAKPDADNEDE